MEPICDLSPLAREILWLLPAAPWGLSVSDLAEELLEDRSPHCRGMIHRGLAEVGGAVRLHIERGLDGHGRIAELHGLEVDELHRVRRAAAALGERSATDTELGKGKLLLRCPRRLDLFSGPRR